MNLPPGRPGTHDPHRPPQNSSGAEGEPATKRKPEAESGGWGGSILMPWMLHPYGTNCYGIGNLRRKKNINIC